MNNKKQPRRNSFSHLDQGARDRIQALRDAGHLQKEMAQILQVDKSTISREINLRKRKNGHYQSTTAQHKASVKRSNSKYQGMKIENEPALKADIILLLHQKRSPDEIAGRWKREHRSKRASKNAIYKWLYSRYGQRWCHLLCTRRYKKRKQKNTAKREMIPNKIPLAQRPKQGEHAEGDLFVSPTKSSSQRSGAIVCVPSAQLLVGTMIANKKPATMVFAVKTINDRIDVDDFTWDNGMENRYHEQFGTDNYFADPHAPWQKPHVENGIGLMRRWFIKRGTNLDTVLEPQYQEYLHILNSKYRKSLGYQSAYEVALKRGIIQKIPAFGAGELTNINMLEVAFQGRI